MSSGGIQRAKRKGSKWRERMFRLVWMIQKGVCERCGVKESFFWRKGGVSGSFDAGDLNQWIWRTSTLELDHAIPLHRGGSNDPDNLQLLCVDCHKAKSSRERSERAAA